MADLTLPEVITRFRGNEARIADFANGNAAGYYITTDGKKVETLPSVVSRLAAAIAAASATADTLKGTGGAKLIGFGTVTVDAALTTQAKGIADNAKAIADLDKVKLAKDGGTMTGLLKLSGDPTDPLHPATKGWAENLIGAYWKPGVGDLLTTVRGAPDASWIPDGTNYLQASYPDLFAKLGILQSDNTTTPWTQVLVANINTGGASGYQAFFGVANGVLLSYDSTNAKIVRSADGGATFTSIASPISGSPCALATDGKGTWMAGSTAALSTGQIMRSTDNGLTWQVAGSLPGASSWYTVSIATDGKGTWVVSGNAATYYRSTDNGATWTGYATISGSYRCITYATGTTWYAAYNNNGLLKSTDNGLTWVVAPQPLYGGNYSIVIQGLSYSGGILAVTGYYGISNTYYCVGGLSADGVNWRWWSMGSLGSALYPQPVVFGRDGIALCAGYTAGTWRINYALDPSHASGISITTAANINSYTNYPAAMCTDGLSTWYCVSSNSGGITRNLPAYDVKTQFRVPKSLAQPAPFATFVKAK
ncbi:WD40/YVTN/BNR-like repeat-containing protein [Pseudomonas benzopyrenica]|uniref:WD40/YVTN/BNR-like repeat-containing protein n=1 Tax=Pseudomonas benzopyrenica TaxID=2993566 RepID=UPI0022816F31|nr:sialidase family protein [Pseudomonas benzopyrenica]MDC7831614.1 sialidase family protein [Pseudomonas benzopyrenica]